MIMKNKFLLLVAALGATLVANAEAPRIWAQGNDQGVQELMMMNPSLSQGDYEFKQSMV